MNDDDKEVLTGDERVIKNELAKMRSDAWETPTLRAMKQIRKEAMRRRFYGAINMAGCAAAAILILVALIPSPMPSPEVNAKASVPAPRLTVTSRANSSDAEAAMFSSNGAPYAGRASEMQESVIEESSGNNTGLLIAGCALMTLSVGWFFVSRHKRLTGGNEK
ncbi:MAG: hypothetical protein PHI27_04615 [Eubacteriales bacterium]|nr:hypothetical protein [Eubacteriales bacterium]MDD3881516.1 hypothetical protein [Eubacteriales bacterium]MDD4513002.1 hypothetical protein [Eubacteriales bacterium]